MTPDSFLKLLQAHAESFSKAVSTTEGEWIIKGFIDVYKNVYSISVDTKIVSKVLELLLFPMFVEFATTHGFDIELSPQQNFYPDLTLIDQKTKVKFAIDIKSTYRISDNDVNGMTLGAFTGYFRNRNSSKNILYPYGAYSGHYVLGVLYTKVDGVADERKRFTLADLESIPSVIKDFTFFAQPKFKIATSRPGSGNTKNIGSVTKIDQLIGGKGAFSALGEEVYDDYWMFYLTRDMAQTLGVPRPYTDLKSYLAYKSKGLDVLTKHRQEILDSSEGEEGSE